MAESYARRYAKCVQAYARLKELYRQVKHERSILIDELRDSRNEVRRLEREARDLQHASRHTLANLFTTARYAAINLREGGNEKAAQKIEEWVEALEENVQPVTEVTHLIKLLDEWCAANGDSDTSALYLRTKMALNDISRPNTRG